MNGDVCVRRQRSYWTTCKCPSCVVERRRTRKLHDLSETRRVPNEAAWRVLEDRINRGWTALALASACGLPDYHFSSLLANYRKGRRQHLGPVLAATIVTMGTPTKGSVGAEPSRRRLRALAAVGFGLDTLAVETGINATTLAMVRGANERIGSARANTIADAYDRLRDADVGEAQTKRLAAEKGWPAPHAWLDIDDLDETPDPGYRTPHWRAPDDYDFAVVERILARDFALAAMTSRAEKEAVCVAWQDRGDSVNELAELTGWEPRRYLCSGREREAS